MGPPHALLEHQPIVSEHVVVLGTLDQVRTLAGFLGRPCHYYLASSSQCNKGCFYETVYVTAIS